MHKMNALMKLGRRMPLIQRTIVGLISQYLSYRHTVGSVESYRQQYN